MELEVWQKYSIPECWSIVSRANVRAEKPAGTQEGASLIYKINLCFKAFPIFADKSQLCGLSKGQEFREEEQRMASREMLRENCRYPMIRWMQVRLMLPRELSCQRSQERTTIGDKKT